MVLLVRLAAPNKYHTCCGTFYTVLTFHLISSMQTRSARTEKKLQNKSTIHGVVLFKTVFNLNPVFRHEAQGAKVRKALGNEYYPWCAAS